MEETGDSASKRSLPVFLRILKGFWCVIRFIFRLIFGRVGMMVLLLLLVADWFLESRGISGKHLDRFQQKENGVLFQCRWMQIGVFKGIVLHGVSFDVNTKAGPLVVHARRVSAQMNWTKIFRELGWVPNAVMVSGVKMELLGPKGEPSLVCDVQDGSMVFTGDEQVRVVVNGKSHGIKLQIEGTLTKVHDFLASLEGDSKPITPDPDLADLVEKIGENINNFGRMSDDSSISLSFDADCTKWLEGSVNCHFCLFDLLVKNVVISKFRGSLEGGMKKIRFDNVDVLLSRSETISASGCYYPESKELQADFNGSVTPSTICQLAGVDAKDWLTHRVRIPALEFYGNLPRCKLELSDMSPNLTCKLMSSFEAFGVDVERGSFNMSYGKEKLHVKEISFWLSKDGREHLGGDLEVDFNTMLMEGKLNADLVWLERLRKYGIYLPSSILRSDSDPASIEITLDKSPMDWREMKLNGSLEDHDLYFLTQHSQRLRIDFSFNENYVKNSNDKNQIPKGIFKIKQLQVDLDQTEKAVSLNATCNIVNGMDSGESKEKTASGNIAKDKDSGDNGKGLFSTEFNIAVLARSDAKSDPKEGLTCNGTFDYWVDGQNIQLKCKGLCHPDWIYQSYCRQLDLSSSYVFVLLGTGERPVEYTLDLPKMSLDKGDKWKLNASVHGYDSYFGSNDTQLGRNDDNRYATFRAKEISCDVMVDSTEVDITNIQATTIDDESLRLDIRVQYSPLEFSIKDLELEGNPALAEAFILNSNAQDVYRKIWSEVKWSEKRKPMVRMPTLIYKDGSPWSLRLTAHVNAPDVLYHEYMAEEMNLIVSLDLPSSLSLKPITLKTQKGDVYGEVSLSFGGVPQCTFKIDATEGYVNPKTLLTTVNRDFEKHLKDITFSDETHLNLTGEMFLSGDPRISVSGTLNCPELKWDEHKLQDVDSTWSYSSNGIAWNVKQATFLDGTLRTNGVYELENSRGEFLAFFNDIPLASVSKVGGLSKEGENVPKPGVFSGGCHGRFLMGWGGRFLNLEGAGHVALRGADFRTIPFLKQLSELFPSGSESGAAFGSISEFDADIEFLGNRLSVPQLYTNGTIMALHGKGEYSFEDKKVNFLVNGVPLRDISILSLALSPLSWAFQAELTGTRSAYKWRMKHGLMRFLNIN